MNSGPISNDPSPPDPLNTTPARRSALMAILASAALVGSVAYRPWAQDGPILCPLRLFTGLPCPSCGMTRSFCAIAQGDFVHAFQYHLFGPLLYFSLLIALPMLIYQAVTGRYIQFLNRTLFSSKTAFLLGCVLLSYHLTRLAHLAASGTLWTDMQKSLAAKALHFGMHVLGFI